MQAIPYINFIIAVAFMLCYSYQIFYIFYSLIHKPKTGKKKIKHRYGVMICARNEEQVIPHLIDSIKKQTYDQSLIDIYVVSDNCTDSTAEVAEKAGARVFVRRNREKVGKGYAMEFLYDSITAEKGEDYYDGYFVFDADNLLDENYIAEMNKSFSDGARIVTGYRNSKNYGTNWISAGYALWFLRESRYLNNSRALLGVSAAVSGTGFLFHRDIIKRCGGWKYFLLTEDIEFTADNILNGEKVGYCHSAVLYDEQPTSFKQSWHQRMRWAKGYLQVFKKYGTRLVKGLFSKSAFSCFDMIMTIMPAVMLTTLSVILNLTSMLVAVILNNGEVLTVLFSVLESLMNTYLLLFGIGVVTGITEWKKIGCRVYKKILYLFTFPLFMLTYIPISITAFFKKVEWRPVKHNVGISIEKLQSK